MTSKRNPRSVYRSSCLSGIVLLTLAAMVHAEIPGGEDEPLLPRAASWNCRAGDGYSPEWQYEQIEAGHKLLFTYRFDQHQTEPDAEWRDRYQPIFEGLRERGEPICLRWGNWLDIIEDRSPFSEIEPWRTSGQEMFDQYRAKLELIQQWYPSPPYVVMLSNNEGQAPNWKRATQEDRYIEQYGEDQSEEEKVTVVAEGYIERYNAMFDGMRAGTGPWGDKLLFIGYAWGGQANINMHNRLDTPLAWDGVSARNYRARGVTDHTGNSTPVTAMNLRLKKAWYATQKERFFFEISTWWQGGSVEPDRYGGMATWALWVAKPHAIRHFTSWGAKRDSDWPYFSELVEAVDQVHTNETLRTFWKQGEPVVNPHTEINIHVIDRPAGEGTRAHGNLEGFVSDEQLQAFDVMRDHFYGLSTNLDPDKPAPASDSLEDRTRYPNDAEFRVWAQAQVMGEAPDRRWLVFTYAPRGDEAGVEITIPDYDTIELDVPQKGVFAVVEEGRGIVETIPTLDIVE